MSITSPYRTASDLVTQVLDDLNVLSVGNPIDVEDFAKVNNALDSILRKLDALEIVHIADVNNIPGAWFKDLATIVAGEVCSGFGFVGQEFQDKVNNGLGGQGGVEIGAGAAAKSLKIIGRGRPTYEPLRFVNF
jgi:hypothetical protein